MSMTGETSICNHPELSRGRSQQQLQIIKARGELKFSMRPSCLEPSEASSGGSIPQKIIDVVFPAKISNRIREPTYASGLEGRRKAKPHIPQFDRTAILTTTCSYYYWYFWTASRTAIKDVRFAIEELRLENALLNRLLLER